MTSHQRKQAQETAHTRQASKPLTQRPVVAEQQTDLSTLQRTVANPRLATPGDILALQRPYGNRAVTRLLQTKLRVGPVGDKYEREADRVADQVMSQPSAVSRQPLAGAVRRQEEEEEDLQMRPLAASITPLGQPFDRLRTQRQEMPEEEELQMKPLVQRQEMPEEEEIQVKPLLQRQEVPEEEELQMKPLVQRQAEEEEEEVQMKPLVQRQAEEEEEVQMKPLVQRQVEEEEEEPVQAKSLLQRQADGSFEASSNLEQRLAIRKGSGSPLSDEARAFMEPRFDADFSGVRVHTDGEASQLNRELNAQSFTHGQDIYFGPGKYDPGSDAGKRLLAHELTHTIQQTGGAQLEREADTPVQTTPSAPAIQRIGDPSPASALSISAAPSDTIQMLMNSTELKNIAGDPKWGWFRSSKYKKILKKLDQYHQFLARTESPLNSEEKIRRLKELERLATDFIAAKGEEFTKKQGDPTAVRRIQQRVVGMSTFVRAIQADIKGELASRELRVRTVLAHVEKEKKTTGGVKSLYRLRRLKEELMRFPTFALLGRDAGPQRFVDAYNNFMMEYNNLVGIVRSFRRYSKPIPRQLKGTLQERAVNLTMRLNEKMGEGIEPSRSPRQQLAGVIRNDFLGKDPELLYEALGLNKKQGREMTATEIQQWGNEKNGKVKTLGGKVGRKESGNPFRQALFYLRGANNKALYDAFLEGTDEALKPFFFPEKLKQRYLELGLAATGLVGKLNQ